jgi:hypothetical protein
MQTEDDNRAESIGDAQEHYLSEDDIQKTFSSIKN